MHRWPTHSPCGERQEMVRYGVRIASAGSFAGEHAGHSTLEPKEQHDRPKVFHRKCSAGASSAGCMPCRSSRLRSRPWPKALATLPHIASGRVSPFSSRREPRARAGTSPKCAPAAARAPFQTPHELQPSLPRSRTGRTHVPPGCVTSPDARMPLYPASATLPRCPERHRKTSRPRLSLLSADLRQGCNRRAIEDSLRIINHGVIRIPVKKT